MINRKTYSYTYEPNSDNPITPIKIRSGPYIDLIFRYGQVGIDVKENGDGTKTFNFEYEIVDNPHNYDSDQELFNVLGDILVDIIKTDGKVKKIKNKRSIFNRRK